VNGEESRGPKGGGDLVDADWREEERPQSNQEPIAQAQARRPPTPATKHDQLLLEYEILGNNRSHVTGPTQFRYREAR
jgi:hypothetical protein